MLKCLNAQESLSELKDHFNMNPPYLQESF